MEQKCIFISSIWKVFEVFVDEPLKTHYIKEISKKINLAPTSVKKHIGDLEKQEIITKKKGERFGGYTANRNNDKFFFYKKTFNLIKIKESGLGDYLIKSIHPKAVVLYGSYLSGEDVEESDIDIFIVSKVKKDLEFKKFERILNRKMHVITEENLKKLPGNLHSEITNGYVLEGYLKDG